VEAHEGGEGMEKIIEIGIDYEYEVMECGNCGCRAFSMTRTRDANSTVRGHVWNTDYNCLGCGEKSVTNNKGIEGNHNKLERVSVTHKELIEVENVDFIDAADSIALNWPALTRMMNRLTKLKMTISRMHQAVADRLSSTLE